MGTALFSGRPARTGEVATHSSDRVMQSVATITSRRDQEIARDYVVSSSAESFDTLHFPA